MRVRSSMASSKASVGTPTPSGLFTHTISAPRRRQPSHTYMFVGKFWSV